METNSLCSHKEHLEHNRTRYLWFSDTFCYRESYFLFFFTNKSENIKINRNYILKYRL